MSNPAPQRQPLPVPETRDPGVLVDVLVLSEDLLLFDAIRGAIGERNPVWRARSAEESVDLLLTGRCGVLLVDMAAVSTRPATLITEIVGQFPDVVVVVAGRLEDETLLAGLISDGFVYRFMHKPLTAKRAGMFLQAAIRRHVEQREAHSTQPLLPLATMLPGRFDPWKWLFVAAGLSIFMALLWLFLGGGLNQLADSPAPAPASAAGAYKPPSRWPIQCSRERGPPSWRVASRHPRDETRSTCMPPCCCPGLTRQRHAQDSTAPSIKSSASHGRCRPTATGPRPDGCSPAYSRLTRRIPQSRGWLHFSSQRQYRHHAGLYPGVSATQGICRDSPLRTSRAGPDLPSLRSANRPRPPRERSQGPIRSRQR